MNNFIHFDWSLNSLIESRKILIEIHVMSMAQSWDILSKLDARIQTKTSR